MPINTINSAEISNYNSSDILTSYQNSVIHSNGFGKIIYSQFINCGPDPNGASIETNNGQNNITLSNFVNITSNGSYHGFLTVGKAQLFIDQCFIELKACDIFISLFRPNNTELISISNSNIITSISIDSQILETKSVNVVETRGELTFADIAHVYIPSCNYSSHECTCELNFFFFNNIQFLLLFQVFILLEF